MKKPGILIICPFFPPNLGGVETHLQLLTDHLNRNDYRVNVLTYQPLVTKVDHYLPFEKKGNLTIHRFRWFGMGWFDRLTLYPIFQFIYVVPGLLFNSVCWSLSHHLEFDVIHAHGFAAAFIARIIGLFFPQKKKIVSTHFIYRRLNPKSFYATPFKWVFKTFDHILLIGKKSGKELTRLGLPKEKMHHFRLWLNTQKITPVGKAESRQNLKLPQNKKLYILYAGRILRMKGVFELLSVAQKISQDIVFVVVGDGPDYDELKKESSSTSNFLMLGRKTRSQVFEYLAAADILVLPSLSDEAQPNVIMEALISGRPVIITNKGSAKEMIDSSVGLVIEPTSAKIYEAITTLYHDKALLDKLTKATHQYATQHFSPSNAAIITNYYLQ